MVPASHPRTRTPAQSTTAAESILPTRLQARVNWVAERVVIAVPGSPRARVVGGEDRVAVQVRVRPPRARADDLGRPTREAHVLLGKHTGLAQRAPRSVGTARIRVPRRRRDLMNPHS